MKRSWRIALSLAVVMLAFSGCGNDPSYPPNYSQPASPNGSYPQATQPTNPDNTNTTPKVRAAFQLGETRREFNQSQSTSCIVDSTRGEAIITFADTTQASSLGIRLSGFNQNQTIATIDSKNASSSILLSVGNNKKQDLFRNGSLSDGSNPTNCAVTYQVLGTYLQGRFRCDNLVNANDQSLSASGGWLCQIQPAQDIGF